MHNVMATLGSWVAYLVTMVVSNGLVWDMAVLAVFLLAWSRVTSSVNWKRDLVQSAHVLNILVFLLMVGSIFYAGLAPLVMWSVAWQWVIVLWVGFAILEHYKLFDALTPPKAKS